MGKEMNWNVEYLGEQKGVLVERRSLVGKIRFWAREGVNLLPLFWCLATVLVKVFWKALGRINCLNLHVDEKEAM